MEGPFYRPGAPLLDVPYCLIRRAGERGTVLFVSATVASTAGERLGGALVDIWQASAEGRYSPGAEAAGTGGSGEFSRQFFDLAQPAFNLRGRLRAGSDGEFEVRSVVPGAYRDPPGSLSETDMRPSHLHWRISHPGFVTLTTQIFFEEDPYLATDPAEVVRPALVTPLVRRYHPADLAAWGLLRPYFTCHVAFVLRSLPPGQARQGWGVLPAPASGTRAPALHPVAAGEGEGDDPGGKAGHSDAAP